MATLSLLIFTAMVVLLRAPDTRIARWLHARLVAPLAARLARVERATVIIWVLIALVVWLAGREGAQLFAMGLPELAGWMALVDFGVLVDIAAALVVTVAVTPVRTLATALGTRLRRPRPRAPHRARQRPAANDDDGSDRRKLAA